MQVIWCLKPDKIRGVQCALASLHSKFWGQAPPPRPPCDLRGCSGNVRRGARCGTMRGVVPVKGF